MILRISVCPCGLYLYKSPSTVDHKVHHRLSFMTQRKKRATGDTWGSMEMELEDEADGKDLEGIPSPQRVGHHAAQSERDSLVRK